MWKAGGFNGAHELFDQIFREVLAILRKFLSLCNYRDFNQKDHKVGSL